MSGIQAAVIMGSSSDKKVMDSCLEYLEYFGISYESKVISAHRNPDELDAYINQIKTNCTEVIIAGAGMAAALPGVIASKVIIPVIGVPIDSSSLSGTDALYSIVQMPPGIPVATVAIGPAGAKNAAVLALQILALNDSTLKNKLKEFRRMGSKLKK
ncbi:MAG: 5-(carboxyamino)imidazole ribonucleotide mutase [bacterium]